MLQTREPSILRRRKNHLPEDIVLNILTRLPPKSVIRFRCVCKSWDSSITTPKFISAHLNNFAHDNDNSDGYIVHKPWFTRAMDSNRRVCTVALDRTFDRISEIEFPFDLTSWSVQILGSCNGLLCLADIGNFNISDHVIYLWNPSIRKFKRLPGSCLQRLDCYGLRLGFAYDSENNDYKVVTISRCLAERLPPIPDVIELYTLSSDSWRRVEMPLRTNILSIDNSFLLPSPLVSGALHWISLVLEGEEENGDEVIMSFDVNSEKFRMLVMPDGSLLIMRSQRSLALFKGKLAFITFGITDQHGYITPCG